MQTTIKDSYVFSSDMMDMKPSKEPQGSNELKVKVTRKRDCLSAIVTAATLLGSNSVENFCLEFWQSDNLYSFGYLDFPFRCQKLLFKIKELGRHFITLSQQFHNHRRFDEI